MISMLKVMALSKQSSKEELAKFEIKELEELEGGKCSGSGSFGTVFKVKVDGVTRIAKRLHNVLIAPDIRQEDKAGIRERFYNECLLLSKLDHPCIVQFVGVHFHGLNRSDVMLVMECLHTDLDRFLDPKKRPNIPLSIKLSILLDVSAGLLYLHHQLEEPLVHRDLKAENILITNDVRAKIADLGVSKLLKNYPNQAAIQTQCPGTLAYMPPEALCEDPQYDTSLDIFSYGQLALYTALQKFPQVFNMVRDPKMTSAIRLGESEILRRKKWIDLIGEHHCLRGIILQCLKDDSTNRPKTLELKKAMKTLCVIHPKSLGDIVSIMEHDVHVYNHLSCKLADMEKTIALVEVKNQVLEEEQGKQQEKLREARTESHRLQSERKLLDNELETSKRETIRFSVEKDDLKVKYDTVVAENNQLLKNIERMSELCLQVVEANKRIKELEQQLALDQVKMKQYQEDFRQERQDRETAHGLIADMEKECIKDGDYQQLSDRLREAEEANKLLLDDLETVRREAREEQEMVHQEMQAKSSQVKQYAKENDRLKKALEEAGSKLSSSIPHDIGENRPFICSHEDLENLRDENVRYREKIDQLEIINAQLQENQAASTASTSLPTENSESVPGLINKHVGRTIKSWPQESTCGQASESPQTGSRIEADSANLQGQIVESESDHIGQDKRYSRQSSNDYENWPIDRDDDVIIPKEETSAPVPNETEGTSSTYDHIDVCKQQEADRPHPSPHHIDQHHMLPVAALEVSSTNYSQRKMLNFGSEGQQITGSNTNCEAIQLDDFNNREQRETTHPLEDSTVLFENEIHQQAAQVIQEVSGSRREANTDLKRPFDPNLVCPMCRKQFRFGEIQRFRRHVNTCTGTSDV